MIGIEILALAIKKNPKIEGIRVGAREIKITQYADDTSVFLRNLESVSVMLDLLEKFENGRTEMTLHSTLRGRKTLFLL